MHARIMRVQLYDLRYSICLHDVSLQSFLGIVCRIHYARYYSLLQKVNKLMKEGRGENGGRTRKTDSDSERVGKERKGK